MLAPYLGTALASERASRFTYFLPIYSLIFTKYEHEYKNTYSKTGRKTNIFEIYIDGGERAKYERTNKISV